MRLKLCQTHSKDVKRCLSAFLGPALWVPRMLKMFVVFECWCTLDLAQKHTLWGMFPEVWMPGIPFCAGPVSGLQLDFCSCKRGEPEWRILLLLGSNLFVLVMSTYQRLLSMAHIHDWLEAAKMKTKNYHSNAGNDLTFLESFFSSQGVACFEFFFYSYFLRKSVLNLSFSYWFVWQSSKDRHHKVSGNMLRPFFSRLFKVQLPSNLSFLFFFPPYNASVPYLDQECTYHS